MKNKRLIEAAKNILRELLSECTEDQFLVFKRMYCHENLDMTIDEVLDQMDPLKMDYAITQCERTVIKNKSNIIK